MILKNFHPTRLSGIAIGSSQAVASTESTVEGYQARLEEPVLKSMPANGQYGMVTIHTVPNHSASKPRGGRGRVLEMKKEREGEEEGEKGRKKEKEGGRGRGGGTYLEARIYIKQN